MANERWATLWVRADAVRERAEVLHARTREAGHDPAGLEVAWR